METTPTTPEPHEPDNQGDESNAGGDDTQGADKLPALVHPSESISAKPMQDDAGGDKGNKPDGWWKGFLYDVTVTDVAVTFFAGATVWVAIYQNSLTAESNRIANVAAKAAEDASKAASDALALAKAGEVQSNEVAEATKKTADATAITALAAQKSADAAQGAARATSAAVEQARLANTISQEAATAATTMASWSAFAAEKQLRAYLSIDGCDLVFDKRTRTCVATVYVVNSGRTPAHNVRDSSGLTCAPVEENRPLGGTGTQTPPSVGPLTSYEIKIEISWPANANANAMTCGVQGRIDYTDELGKERYTEYKYYKSDAPTAGTDPNLIEFAMLLAEDGNASN
jgi:hypothetical protein